MTTDGFLSQLPDIDPEETAEWLESLDVVAEAEGKTRARYLLGRLNQRGRQLQLGNAEAVSTDYVNTIPTEQQPFFPGNEHLERRIRAYIRWNAAAMVIRANKRADGIGGHLSTFASSAALYEVGFNHFFRGKEDGAPGDAVYIQGHAAPGVYARAFLEGRLDEDRARQLPLRGRRWWPVELPPPPAHAGLLGVPHGVDGPGPDQLHLPGPIPQQVPAATGSIDDTSGSRVWAFLGDGECDEPETLGSISLAARHGLDNLTWVINCNLQRLDGPVRGNGKIIQELEAVFRGAGWNVIKVVWGGRWDELLQRDVDGVLRQQDEHHGGRRLPALCGGETAPTSGRSSSAPTPACASWWSHLTDDDLRNLPRGGHDYQKVYAAYAAAVEHTGQPTVILAKTVKGWTLGEGFESRNATHQIKKMTKQQMLELRDRLYLHEEIRPDDLETGVPPYYRPSKDSEEYQYMMGRRRALDGPLPQRQIRVRRPLPQPSDVVFKGFQEGSGGRVVSTTMVFTGLLRELMREEGFGHRVVPIVPDEARTFGMDSMFREFEIYAPFGQKYEPVDHELLLSYSEDTDGQILEEGITEAGSLASWIAAATSYAHRGVPMVPFYTFYSMFGFQRVGDLIWSAADSRARGFLMGATAGRTTLAGEGLQHQDGHSLLHASAVPACQAYDPAFAYELAAIIADGIKRMYVDNEDIFYYLTIYNENYDQPPQPAGSHAGILQGLYRWATAPEGLGNQATILFSGPSQGPARAAQQELAERWGVGAELWSATSYKRLREDGLDAERWNRLNPTTEARVPLVTRLLADAPGPIVAVSDFVRAVPDLIAPFVPKRFVTLGTDGYGRSDTREALRSFFETDMPNIVVTVLYELSQAGRLDPATVADAISHYGLDAASSSPWYR